GSLGEKGQRDAPKDWDVLLGDLRGNGAVEADPSPRPAIVHERECLDAAMNPLVGVAQEPEHDPTLPAIHGRRCGCPFLDIIAHAGTLGSPSDPRPPARKG